MNQIRITEILLRLGFFHVKEDVESGKMHFLAGHIESALQEVVTLDVASGKLEGTYAAFMERLDEVLSRYQCEEFDAVYLSPDGRQAWLSELARDAGVTPEQLHFMARSVDS